MGVNLCLGYLSGHTLAEPWHLFQRISRCNGLSDALLAERQALHIYDQAFIQSTQPGSVLGLGPSGNTLAIVAAETDTKSLQGVVFLTKICGPLKQSMWHPEELLSREGRRESSKMTFELGTFWFAGSVGMPRRLHTGFLGCHHGPLPSVDG